MVTKFIDDFVIIDSHCKLFVLLDSYTVDGSVTSVTIMITRAANDDFYTS